VVDTTNATAGVLDEVTTAAGMVDRATSFADAVTTTAGVVGFTSVSGGDADATVDSKTCATEVTATGPAAPVEGFEKLSATEGRGTEVVGAIEPNCRPLWTRLPVRVAGWELMASFFPPAARGWLCKGEAHSQPQYLARE
jgi:hypothetical protein